MSTAQLANTKKPPLGGGAPSASLADTRNPNQRLRKSTSIARDSHGRALAKAASWRLGGAAVTTAIAWTLSGEATFAASMGTLDVLVKFGCYYLHERVWDRIAFGRASAPDLLPRYWKRSGGDELAELG